MAPVPVPPRLTRPRRPLPAPAPRPPPRVQMAAPPHRAAPGRSGGSGGEGRAEPGRLRGAGSGMMPPGEPQPPAGSMGNLAALAELDEASLLQGLRERFLRQQVYVSAAGGRGGGPGRRGAGHTALPSRRQTDVGDILIALNPFQPLQLYGREVSGAPRTGSPFHGWLAPRPFPPQGPLVSSPHAGLRAVPVPR